MHEALGTIDGSGNFAGEAGPFGTLAVSGTVANDSLHLRIIFVYDPTVFLRSTPDTSEFAGVLTDRDHIDGKMTRGGSTFPTRFERSTNPLLGARERRFIAKLDDEDASPRTVLGHLE
jgi:hypothetical protein